MATLVEVLDEGYSPFDGHAYACTVLGNYVPVIESMSDHDRAFDVLCQRK